MWEQGWRSGERTRLPPMWPGFDSLSRRHMWVEFVVGSRPCSEGFSPGTPVFLPSQKPTFPNSNSTWKQWMELSHPLESTKIPIFPPISGPSQSSIIYIRRVGVDSVLHMSEFRASQII